METSFFADKKIVLGVTGGIASYKVVEWVRSLRGENADVHVVMTESATKFVSPMVFAAISSNPVHTDTFSETDAEKIPHISLAKEADLILIAPATANMIAKLAHGIADDLLSTIVLATKAKVVICPAMNTNMLCHKATRANLKKLLDYDYVVISPDQGALACGDEGPGRLPDWQIVCHKILATLSPQDLAGQNIIITAGPTRESIDPVRFISNRSSGKMGFALAATANRRGGDVTLISGPTNLETPPGVRRIDVTTAEEMRREVLARYDNATIIVKAAAVSDYRPVSVSPHKIKKSKETSSIELEMCPDILKELGGQKSKTDQFPLLVGFAAESQNHIEEGTRKLNEKNLDAIVVNDILASDAGFEADTNRVIIIDREENTTELPLLSKEETADHIWSHILRFLTVTCS